MIMKLTSIGLFSSFLVHASANSKPKDDICLTPNCVKAAAHILDNLHPDYDSIDPCTNFDQYVCGGFPGRFPNEQSWETLTEVGKANQYILKTIMETPYSKSNDSNANPDDEAAFDMLVTNYNSCMNETAVNASALGGIPQIIEQITNLFPVGDANETLAESDYDSLADVIAYLSSIGIPIFGEFWTIADNQSPDIMIPQFGFNIYNTADHALPAEIIPSELYTTYKEEDITAILEVLLPDSPTKNASVSSLAKGVIGLAKAIKAAEDELAGDPAVFSYGYTIATVEEAAKKAPALVLDRVIPKLAPEGYEFDRLVFQYQDVYGNISDVVSKTPKATLQALMMILTYKSYAPYVAGSIDPLAYRWDACYKYVDGSLAWIAGKFFIEATYTDEKRDFITTMAKELQTAFGDRVKEKEWLSEETKKLIEEKVSEIILKIGYPDSDPEILNSTDLLQYYKGVEVGPSLYENALSIRKWAVNHAWDALNRPTDPNIWPEHGTHPYSPNARYGFNYNHIAIGSGITQPPMMYMGAPSYLMYSSVGYIAGHEVTHGFDSIGRLWNNERQFKTWWDEGSIEEFNNRTQCFIDQYANMEVRDLNGEFYLNVTDGKPLRIDGELTLSENIADAGGLANAWVAWKHHEEKEASQMLPGLEKFTKEQLFWIGMGQVWCSKYEPGVLTNYLQTDPHAPGSNRILGSAENSRAFKETWQCEKKEPVCEIW